MLDRGGKVFNRTAPVIKLPAGSTEDEHLGLLGLLNSSVACFWLKQVCQNRGSTVDQKGARQRTAPFEDFFEIGAGLLGAFPMAAGRPVDLSTRLDALAQQITALQPAALLARGPLPTRASLDAARAEVARLRRRMIALQEELDWQCYRLYSLLPSDAEALEYAGEIEVDLGQRAFEIVLARRLAAGREQTTWFERHGSTPIAEIPSHWPEDYRHVVQRRIERIEIDRNIGLIERPEYKRRWNTLAWKDVEQAALRDWLLDRLEQPRYWSAGPDAPQLTTTNRLADVARADAEFLQIAALYAGHGDFDVALLVAERVTAESVPFLPVLRYSETGLGKRAQWENTWALQRREDSGEEVGRIPVPPKYQSKDFLKADFWRLRGGLDVPKERWISYPGCERGNDGSLVIARAGWDHLQQATALAAYTLDMKDHEGWEPARLQPLLGGLLELVPWLQQWHNDLDPTYGERMGDYYAAFVADETRALGFTPDDLRAWKPTPTASRRGRRTVENG